MPIFTQATSEARRPAQQGFESSRRSAQQGFTSIRRSAQQGFTSSRRSAQQGFTLLEMLVALAIFSLAGLALLRLQAVSVRTAGDLDARVLAEIVARNIAFERLTDPTPPARGQSQGEVDNAGRRFRWTQTVETTDDQRILKVTVVVTGEAARSPAVISIARPAI